VRIADAAITSADRSVAAARALDDLERLKEEIMPKVDAS
jgi:hypothetical protein